MRAGSVDEVGTPSGGAGTVGADPYINPIYGSKYKLPDRGDIYRFLDNNDFNNRFFYEHSMLGFT